MRLLLAATILLSACHQQELPTPTAQEADQLNDTEDMLNGMAANAEGPADRSAGPSNSSD